MEKERTISFDIAKGIGILLVVLGHVLPEGSFLRHFIFSFHMPLFFFLSGAVTFSSNKKTKDAIYAEIRKLFVNFIFWSALYILFDLVINLLILRSIEPSYLLFNTYLTVIFEGIGALWFLPALMASKIILILLTKLTKNRIYLSAVALTMFMVPFISNEIFHILDKPLSNMWLYALLLMILRNITMASFVLMGFVCKELILRLTKSTSIWKQLLFLLPLCVNLLLCNLDVIINYYFLHMGIPVLSLAMGVSGSLGVVALSSIIARRQNWFSRFWLFLGKNSLFIMATHDYFLLKSMMWTAAMLLFHTDNAYVPALLLIGLEIVLCVTVAPFTDRFTSHWTRRIDRIYVKRQLAKSMAVKHYDQ